MNIRFEYLYRDAGNFKNWGAVVFTNANNYDTSYLNDCVRKKLIDSEFFIADRLNVPNLQFKDHIRELDHDWHEFHLIEPTTEYPNDKKFRDISEFIETIETSVG